jgi:hypothetical protein
MEQRSFSTGGPTGGGRNRDRDKPGGVGYCRGGVRGGGIIRATGGPGRGARGRPDGGGHGQRVFGCHDGGGRTQKGAAFGLVVGRQPLSRKGRATASVDGRQGPVIGSVLA